MKTHLFFSPANKEVVAVVADNFQEANKFLNEMLTMSGTIIKDDYIYHGSLGLTKGTMAVVATNRPYPED